MPREPDAPHVIPRPRSPLWIVVLALACETPMHPYRMQTLIKARGKDLVANVSQRNSVYQTIDALERAGLIVVRETARAKHRPERTIYEATAAGRRALRAWVRTGLSVPAREFPEFPAALATLSGVDGPDDLHALLETRVHALEARMAELATPVPNLPRLFLLESEYLAAVVRAEIRWLRRVMADLLAGRLVFPSEQEVRRLAAITSASDLAAESGAPNSTNAPAPAAKAARKRRPR